MQRAPAECRWQAAPAADLVEDPCAAEDGHGDGVVVCCAGRAVEGLGLLEDGDLWAGRGEGGEEEGEEET